MNRFDSDNYKAKKIGVLVEEDHFMIAFRHTKAKQQFLAHSYTVHLGIFGNTVSSVRCIHRLDHKRVKFRLALMRATVVFFPHANSRVAVQVFGVHHLKMAIKAHNIMNSGNFRLEEYKYMNKNEYRQGG